MNKSPKISSYLADVSIPEPPPEVFGGIGQGGWMDKFQAGWKMRRVPGLAGIYVVGRRSGANDVCFSIQAICGRWDIAVYLDLSPKDIMDSLAAGKAVDAMYVDANPHNKYLALDFKAILDKEGIPV